MDERTAAPILLLVIVVSAILIWYFLFYKKKDKKEGELCVPDDDEEIEHATEYKYNSNLECKVTSCDSTQGYSIKDGECEFIEDDDDDDDDDDENQSGAAECQGLPTVENSAGYIYENGKCIPSCYSDYNLNETLNTCVIKPDVNCRQQFMNSVPKARTVIYEDGRCKIIECEQGWAPNANNTDCSEIATSIQQYIDILSDILEDDTSSEQIKINAIKDNLDKLIIFISDYYATSGSVDNLNTLRQNFDNVKDEIINYISTITDATGITLSNTISGINEKLDTIPMKLMLLEANIISTLDQMYSGYRGKTFKPSGYSSAAWGRPITQENTVNNMIECQNACGEFNSINSTEKCIGFSYGENPTKCNLLLNDKVFLNKFRGNPLENFASSTLATMNDIFTDSENVNELAFLNRDTLELKNNIQTCLLDNGKQLPKISYDDKETIKISLSLREFLIGNECSKALDGGYVRITYSLHIQGKYKYPNYKFGELIEDGDCAEEPNGCSARYSYDDFQLDIQSKIFKIDKNKTYDLFFPRQLLYEFADVVDQKSFAVVYLYDKHGYKFNSGYPIPFIDWNSISFFTSINDDTNLVKSWIGNFYIMKISLDARECRTADERCSYPKTIGNVSYGNTNTPMCRTNDGSFRDHDTWFYYKEIKFYDGTKKVWRHTPELIEGHEEDHLKLLGRNCQFPATYNDRYIIVLTSWDNIKLECSESGTDPEYKISEEFEDTYTDIMNNTDLITPPRTQMIKFYGDCDDDGEKGITTFELATNEI